MVDLVVDRLILAYVTAGCARGKEWERVLESRHTAWRYIMMNRVKD